MSDMQWRKANGQTGTYTGPTVELGKAIPRNTPPFGIRRALFDFAFGYVNGFPLWDVLVFSARSLFPSRALKATVEYTDQSEPVTVGTVWIECPQCSEPMPATVHAEVIDPAGDGLNATLSCTPAMTDVHAHVWSHSVR